MAYALVLALAGCMDGSREPGGEPEVPDRLAEVDWPPRKCVEQVCLVDPDHPNAVAVRELYGIERFTQSAGSASGNNIAFEGDWFVLQRGRAYNDTLGEGFAEDIYAYNFSSDELVAVDVDNRRFAARPYIEDGRVAYMRNDAELQGLLLWDVQTRAHTHIETGLAPGEFLWGFDGSWVIFASRGNDDPDLNGYHAFHVEAGERVYLERSPNSDLPKVYGTLTSIDIWDGHVYILAHNEVNGTRVQHVWEVDLESNETRRWQFTGPRLAGHVYAGGEDYLAFWADSRIYVLHKNTGELERVEELPGWCHTSQIIDGWLMASCLPDLAATAEEAADIAGEWALHLPTRQAIRITDERFGGGPPIVTDGERVVFNAIVPTPEGRGLFHPEDGGSNDFYWYDLPDIGSGSGP